jgi:hypothetical protein
MPVPKLYKINKIRFCLGVFDVIAQFESKINSIFGISAKNCIVSDIFCENVLFTKNPPALPLSFVLRKLCLGYPLGGIAPKPRPIPAYRCAINVTDLADIFTVGRPNIFRQKLKISAQTDEPFWRYRHRKYEGVG